MESVASLSPSGFARYALPEAPKNPFNPNAPLTALRLTGRWARFPMSRLTFHFTTPRDLLAKLRRDLSRLNTGVSAGNRELITDCLFDFANTGYSIKEWLKRNTNVSFTVGDVEAYVKATPVLEACRDICNANKHYTITHYSPTTGNVYASVTAAAVVTITVPTSGLGLEASQQLGFRVKVLLTDGPKYEVTEFGAEVVKAWESFVAAKGIQA